MACGGKCNIHWWKTACCSADSTQELPEDAADLLKMGVDINACSLSQLRRLGKEAPGSSIGVRFNPGLGSGGTKSTNVGGPASSFGESFICCWWGVSLMDAV